MSEVNGVNSGASTSSSGSGASNSSNDSRFVPPRLVNGDILVSFPLLSPSNCCIGNCGRGIKGATWTALVNNYIRHLKDIHKVVPGSKRYRCALCDTDLGRQVATHGCFTSQPFLVQSKVRLPFVCDICDDSYPTWRGLSGHKQKHKRDSIQNDYKKSIICLL